MKPDLLEPLRAAYRAGIAACDAILSEVNRRDQMKITRRLRAMRKPRVTLRYDAATDGLRVATASESPHRWTAARRAKFMRTMAAKRRASAQ